MASRIDEMLKRNKLTSLDDLLCVPKDNCKDIPLAQLRAFANHPFHVVDDDKMLELIESIKENGVLTPVVVRPIEADDSKYEIVSGHRRCHAAEKAGLFRVPCVIRELSDDEATVLMVDANIQREEILPSERAFAFKMKMDAMRRSVGRKAKENGGQNVPQNATVEIFKKSHDIIGDQNGISGRTVKRFIRLTELIPPLLEMVDVKTLPMSLGVDISFLSKETQDLLYAEFLKGMKVKPDQVALIRHEEEAGTLTREMAIQIIEGKQRKVREDNLVLPKMILNNYFPQGTKNEDIEATIYQLLDEWKERNESE